MGKDLLIDVDELRKALGFSENCEKCKRNSRECQYDSHFSLMDFCVMFDNAVEEVFAEDE